MAPADSERQRRIESNTLWAWNVKNDTSRATRPWKWAFVGCEIFSLRQDSVKSRVFRFKHDVYGLGTWKTIPAVPRGRVNELSLGARFVALLKTLLYWEHFNSSNEYLWAWDVENIIPNVHRIRNWMGEVQINVIMCPHWIWNHPIEIRLTMIVPPQEEASVCDQFDTETLF